VASVTATQRQRLSRSALTVPAETAARLPIAVLHRHDIVRPGGCGVAHGMPTTDSAARAITAPATKALAIPLN
jgi:hypothetical protein